MIKWFAYIVLLLIIAPALLSAKEKGYNYNLLNTHGLNVPAINAVVTDTTKNTKRQQEIDKEKKIKEIGKAKRLPKPEKLVPANTPPKAKPKRERRPEGLERPPEIPRRSGGG